MYNIFSLPNGFLHKKYSKEQTDLWDKMMHEAAFKSSGGKLVAEELTPGQKSEVAKWAPTSYSTKRAHDRAFGENVERVVIPFTGAEDKIDTATGLKNEHDFAQQTGLHQHTRDVLRALDKKNYQVDDYHSGMTFHRDTPNRQIKIGKVLQHPDFKDVHATYDEVSKDAEGNAIKDASGNTVKTPVKRHISQVYGADPELKSKGRQKAIVITRNRHDVAGMSTDRRWKSCMDMVDGCNKHFLPKDLEHGTLTAYMVHADDHGIAQPIGRVNLKQHTSTSNGLGYIPEESSYGKFPSSAREQVRSWATEKYSMKPGLYTKHQELYDDDGKTIHIQDPDKLIHIPTHKLHTELVEAAHRIVKKPVETDEDGESYGDDRKDRAKLGVEETANRFDDATHAKMVGHALIDHAKTVDGYGHMVHDKFNNEDTEDLSGEDIVHSWAKDQMGQIGKKVRRMVGGMSTEHALDQHAQIHDFMRHAEEPESHNELKKYHGAIVDHLLTNPDTPTRVKDSVVSDMISSHEKHQEHYGKLDFDAELVKSTQHPRVLHQLHTKMIDGDLDHIDGYSDFNSEDYHHMGKHADAKLADHVMNHEDVPEENKTSFLHGLNENHHGEVIQHALTHENVTPESQKTFELVGEHSTHASVVNKLRNRPDTNANNSVFRATQNNIVESTITFKQFLGNILV